MKIADYRTTFYQFTGKVSDITRQLSLAGLAVVWVLKLGNESAFQIPLVLLLPALAFLLALAFDLLQYVVGAITWRDYYRDLETRDLPQGVVDREEHDFGYHPLSKEKPINFFFWSKTAFALAGWLGLLAAVVLRISDRLDADVL